MVSTEQCNLGGVEQGFLLFILLNNVLINLIVPLDKYSKLKGNKIIVTAFLNAINSLQVGVQIFTKRPLEEQERNNINPDDIISCLNKYPKARVKYLEHLVLERKIEVSATNIKNSIGFRMQTVMYN